MRRSTGAAPPRYCRCSGWRHEAGAPSSAPRQAADHLTRARRRAAHELASFLRRGRICEARMGHARPLILLGGIRRAQDRPDAPELLEAVAEHLFAEPRLGARGASACSWPRTRLRAVVARELARRRGARPQEGRRALRRAAGSPWGEETAAELVRRIPQRGEFHHWGRGPAPKWRGCPRRELECSAARGMQAESVAQSPVALSLARPGVGSFRRSALSSARAPPPGRRTRRRSSASARSCCRRGCPMTSRMVCFFAAAGPPVGKLRSTWRATASASSISEVVRHHLRQTRFHLSAWAASMARPS